jgi:S1-C subfamily serine protease
MAMAAPSADPPPKNKPYLGFRYAETPRRGVVVTSVDSKGLAVQMGLKVDDVVRRVNGAETATLKSMADALDKIDAGTVNLVVSRAPGPTPVEIRGVIRKEPGKEVYYFFPTDKDGKLDLKKMSSKAKD